MRIPCLLLFGLLLLPACGSETETPPAKSGDQDKAPPAKREGSTPSMVTGGVDAATAERLNAAMQKGRKFLASQQNEDGGFGFGPESNVGYTAMGVLGLMAGTDRMSAKTDGAILKALRFLVGKQAENGAIFDNPQYVNYHTSTAIGALASARIAEFAKAMTRARDYLASTQITGDESDLSYGGFPYKQESKGIPADLSNLQFAAQALYDADLPKDHPVWKRMQRYLRRVQSNSEGNDEVLEVEVDGEVRQVVSGNDGGAFYGPGKAGLGKGGMVKRSDGKWEFNSYGSMSYALLKCLIFAGVPPSDRRVQMVVKWISDRWTVDKNPGFENAKDPETASQQGFYYYLYTAARTLAEYEEALGKPLQVKDADGRTRNWRKEMVTKLLEMQDEDGSWQNTLAERWDEGNKVLATSYAMQCLAYVTGRLP